MPVIDSILVATDGSEAAVAAEQFAIDLATRLRARLCALTVVEDRWRHGLRPLNGEQPALAPGVIETFLKTRAERAARRFSDRAHAAGLDATCDVAEGRADDCIVARSERVDLLVVGRDGQSREHRSDLVGPTTEAVLRKSRRPVVVVPQSATHTRALLLAFDGSAGAQAAVRLAVDLSTRLGAPTHVFIDSKDKDRAASRFEEVRGLLAGLSVHGRETTSTLGRPDVKIVEVAEEVDGAVIVMGAFGRNRISDYFVGSNAAAVVRTSPRAVILAR